MLVDHLVAGSKEARIADAVGRGPGGAHTLVVGHPFIDIWQAVKPARLGVPAWPVVPQGVDWKQGVCRALGWPHAEQADIAEAWQRIRGSVRDWTDLEPALIGRVEELIDFVTAPSATAEPRSPTYVVCRRRVRRSVRRPGEAALACGGAGRCLGAAGGTDAPGRPSTRWSDRTICCSPGSPLRRMVEGSGAASVILYGPPGTGKTTLASLISQATGRRFEALSALSAGVKEVRAVIDVARRAAAHGEQTVLFIDEVHRFSKTQQDALLSAVENRVVLLVAATTENPSFSVVAPLLSRSLILQLQPLDRGRRPRAWSACDRRPARSRRQGRGRPTTRSTCWCRCRPAMPGAR